MKLPDSDLAWIPSEKLTGYLLSTEHPVGSAKAGFFRGFGFNDHNVELLEAGLLHIAHTVDGDLETPSGRIVRLRTVWIVETGDEKP